MSLRPGTRTEARKKSYKTGVDADEARRRREDNMVEIRKNKREDSLLKKRRDGFVNQAQQQQLLDASQTAAALEKRVGTFLFFILLLSTQWVRIFAILVSWVYFVLFWIMGKKEKKEEEAKWVYQCCPDF